MKKVHFHPHLATWRRKRRGRCRWQDSHRIYLQAVLIKPETDIIKQATHMTLDVAQVVYVTWYSEGGMCQCVGKQAATPMAQTQMQHIDKATSRCTRIYSAKKFPSENGTSSGVAENRN